MAKHRSLLTAILIATPIAILSFPMPSSAADSCDLADVFGGSCPVGGDSIDIGADKTTPGDGGSGGGDRGGSDGGSDGGSGSDNSGDGDHRVRIGELDIPCIFEGTCPDSSDPITIHDLASFTPELVTVSMEPDGWMIVGLPANFSADAETNIETGELFEIPISVRFTPESYDWSWGDGSSSTSSSPGRTWKDLDVEEFTATATSHTYSKKGTYQVGLTVNYSVEIKTPQTEWLTVDGTLSKAASGVTAIATTANSVIVKDACDKNPNGPGC